MRKKNEGSPWVRVAFKDCVLVLVDLHPSAEPERLQAVADALAKLKARELSPRLFQIDGTQVMRQRLALTLTPLLTRHDVVWVTEAPGGKHWWALTPS